MALETVSHFDIPTHRASQQCAKSEPQGGLPECLGNHEIYARLDFQVPVG